MQEDGMRISPIGKIWEDELPAHCRSVHFQWLDGDGVWQPTGAKPVYDRKECVKMVDRAIREGPCKYTWYRLIPATINGADDPQRRGRLERLKAARAPREKKESELALLIRDGGVKTPLQVEAEFKKKNLKATICDDGTIEFGGKKYTSLSAAGSAAKESIEGRPMSTNGFTFWMMRQGKKLIPLPRHNPKS